jgi:murein DD-endopeptidase MepM/ murein hydrolase activator NlpD
MYDSGLLVRTGDRVVSGQQIARVGSNGNSTGCHLHFAVQINGGYVDPKAFLDQVGVTITN